MSSAHPENTSNSTRSWASPVLRLFDVLASRDSVVPLILSSKDHDPNGPHPNQPRSHICGALSSEVVDTESPDGSC